MLCALSMMVKWCDIIVSNDLLMDHDYEIFEENNT